jgi:hypothetical protein
MAHGNPVVGDEEAKKWRDSWMALLGEKEEEAGNGEKQEGPKASDDGKRSEEGDHDGKPKKVYGFGKTEFFILLADIIFWFGKVF